MELTLESNPNLLQDKRTRPNVRGAVSFRKSVQRASGGFPTTRIVINLGANHVFDSEGSQPFGRVIQGMEALDALHIPKLTAPSVQAESEQGVAERYGERGNAWLYGQDKVWMLCSLEIME